MMANSQVEHLNRELARCEEELASAENAIIDLTDQDLIDIQRAKIFRKLKVGMKNAKNRKRKARQIESKPSHQKQHHTKCKCTTNIVEVPMERDVICLLSSSDESNDY